MPPKKAPLLEGTADHNDIKEQQYSSAESVCFSAFDSCMGVMAITPDKKIKAVHLVSAMNNGEFFDAAAAKEVEQLFQGCEKGSVVFVGHMASVWQQLPAYGEMKKAIEAQLGPVRMVEKGRGTYGGKIQSGKIEVTTKTDP